MIVGKEKADRTICYEQFHDNMQNFNNVLQRKSAITWRRCEILEVRTIRQTYMTDHIMLSKWCSCMGDDSFQTLSTTLSAG